MLSIEKCREILDDEALIDERVAEIRDSLYGLVGIVFDEYLAGNSPDDK